ncbi:hypothetical protein CYMTET_17734 [Cymbomonas tetramitiformis]|uniref:Uncharacterized protein n=1 Tax=Cymbomonas tetramitiformis TaxID=36881 RepID=A0AAE0L6N8_9CHLO|nr:hypothetical protein CYMTET_17734 [Cymbomonas tetramitiformis]
MSQASRVTPASEQQDVQEDGGESMEGEIEEEGALDSANQTAWVPKPPSGPPSARWCGGAPPEMLPWSSESATAKLAALLKKKDVNSAKIGVEKAPSALKRCLGNIAACGAEALTTATSLPGVKNFRGQKAMRVGKLTGVRSCALVGNSGHMLQKPYGAYIDNHDLVVRFNTLSTGKYAQKVGEKTTVRLLNHARSLRVCKQPTSSLPEGTNPARLKELKTIVLWHPRDQARTRACLARHFRNELDVMAVSRTLSLQLRAMYRGMRTDVLKLGEKGLKPSMPLELTSGAHAIAMMSRVCRHISVYGMSTYKSLTSGGYQYGGRANLRYSGAKFHDWKLESASWRLMHAAGVATICSL